MTTRAADQLEPPAAADALGVRCQTACRWVRSGRIPARLDNKYVVFRDDLDALDERRKAPASPTVPSRRRGTAMVAAVAEQRVDEAGLSTRFDWQR